MLALHNDKFNEMTRKGYNMNKIKAYLHNSAIIQLHKKINQRPLVIVDQFAESNLYFKYLSNEKDVFKNITFETKAESKFASVAVASIIARYAFLQYFDNLIEESGYQLPKGASNKVDQITAKIIKEKGENYLNKIAKTNFQTLQKAKELIK
jgi:ribonuclease HIII